MTGRSDAARLHFLSTHLTYKIDWASMIKKYRVTGLVNYQVEKGMRLAIPAGQIVEIDQREFEVDGHLYCASMTWTDAKGRQWREKWTDAFWTQLVRSQVKEA